MVSAARKVTNISHNPAIPLLNTYPKDLKEGTQRGFCTVMLIIALVKIGNRKRKTKRPSTDECIRACSVHR